MASLIDDECSQSESEEEEYSVKHMIKELKNNLIVTSDFVVGPTYHGMNKHLAQLYLSTGQELQAIYHLTEAHAASLRLSTVQDQNFNVCFSRLMERLCSDTKAGSEQFHELGLLPEYISFDSSYHKNELAGLMDRLQDMPEEWTVIQITREFDPLERVTMRNKDTPTQVSRLHITRLSCGEMRDVPVSVVVDLPRGAGEGTPSIFDIVHEATKVLVRTEGSKRNVLRNREKSTVKLKAAVTELVSAWLQHWSCLLLGRQYEGSVEKEIRTDIDMALSQDIGQRERCILYAVAEGCAHLSKTEIEKAVTSCLETDHVDSMKVQIAIFSLKQRLAGLINAKRHPVILILDDQIDCLPWEMTSVLRQHPVSRVPSIHFLHALYHKHKAHIQHGLRIVEDGNLGFYVLNPQGDLQQVEERVKSFLVARAPNWVGVAGSEATEQNFVRGLTESNVLLYCGHGNATQVVHSMTIKKLNVKAAVVLLFGCSSVQQNHHGGLVQATNVSDEYIIAGSACQFGMLWSVTSYDADCMAAVLLNAWLPGEQIDVGKFFGNGDLNVNVGKESDLLRLLKPARDAAKLYTTGAALIARGIPVKMVHGSGNTN